MIRMVFAALLLIAGNGYAIFHENSRGAQVHTPYRWVFANSTARLAQSVVANDTDKVAYQKSDSSMWVLRDNSPVTWICLNKGLLTFNAGSIYSLYNEADVDTSPDARFASATIDTAKITYIDSTVRWIAGNTTTLFIVKDTLFACTLYDGSTYRAHGTATAQRRGGVVTVTFPSITGTITSTTNSYITIPTGWKPTGGFSPVVPVPVLSNGAYSVGLYFVGTGLLNNSALSYLTAGNGGLGAGTSITFYLN